MTIPRYNLFSLPPLDIDSLAKNGCMLTLNIDIDSLTKNGCMLTLNIDIDSLTKNGCMLTLNMAFHLFGVKHY